MLGQGIDLLLEVPANATYGAGVRFDGLGLQAFEPKVLEMRLVLLVEVC
jgi:hypothetical protein